MDNQNRRLRFAFHFDLAEARLKEHYPSHSAAGYKQAWADIRSFLEANGFTHTQYSGYESVEHMTYFDAYNILKNLSREFSWFTQCAQGATLTEIGERYDVLEHFRQQAIGRQSILQPAEHPTMGEKTLQSDRLDAPQSREDVARNIAQAVKAKLEARKSKGTPPPNRGKKHPTR